MKTLMVIEKFRGNAALRTEIVALHWGMSGNMSPSIRECTLERNFDKDSDLFMLKMAKGAYFPKIIFVQGETVGRNGFAPRFEWEITDSIMSRYSIGGRTAGKHWEVIGFAFEKLTLRQV